MIRECVICGERVTMSNATEEWESRHTHPKLSRLGPDKFNCTNDTEVAVDWQAGEILHEGDADWHPWDESVFGPRKA